ncbi:SusC/RagA family TonB-linked outer membrane protein [Bacteroides cellulosilyticus]|jgi:TonB-linked SusC/RagA family outer membrane protein|uniref:TonB-dependent receptor n=2 Tax=Bacteroides cellulosilyticus TaxID=246787 RepID=A0A412IBM3_9BACE|nr:TonB-dependent receptor [Bacteroides cellulosilyticus]RGS34224.1 TonB-dependent receptor [Bacteroides cellulosilyticus]
MKHRLASQHYWQSTQGLRKALLILCFSGAPFFPVVEHINATVYVTTTVDQQKKEVKGTIYDETNAPVAGATVVVKSSTRGCITDIDGKFSISVNVGDELLVSFLGYQTENVKITTNNDYTVHLKPKVDELDEVTVVAFAKQKKESVISSVTTVKPSELKVPSSNLTTALAGRMSGVIAYQTSGEPGKDDASFFIRGVTTFGYAASPLILIDNVELTTADLARLNVDDIASFSIMKDATATALYGARGANGVILVTTKEGKEGKATVNIRIENSVSTPVRTIETADPITYMQLHNEAVKTRNPLGVLPYSQSKIDNTIRNLNSYAFPAVDWYDEMFKKYTMNQRVTANISGGGNVARYYIAASFFNDNGVLNVDKQNNFNSNISLKKYSVRSNININLTKTTEAIIRVNGSFDDYRGPIDGGDALYNKVMKTSPVLFPKSFPNVGEYTNNTHLMFGNYGDGTYINPYADMVKGYKDYSRTSIVAQGELKQSLDFITKGLNVRGLISTTRYVYSDVSRYYNPYYYAMGAYDQSKNTYSLTLLNPNGGTEYLNYNEGAKDVTTTNYMEAAMSYNRDFDEHGISGMLVFTRRTQQNSNAGDLQKSLPYKNQGLSGRFTYSYDKRYFAEFNFGYNGSERFAENERYGFFPSFGVGYLMSNEKFWKPLEKTINKLKWKFTYGLVGNDAIGDSNDRFFYLSNVNMNDENKGQDFGTNWGNHINGITVTRYANEVITWEKAKKMNIGIELGLFNKLEIQADVFYEKRNSILMTRSYIPSTMGLTADVRANVGAASGKGIDMSVDYSHSINKDLWVTGRANFTYATSKYEKIEEPDYLGAGTPWRSQVGQKLSQQWGFIAERLFIDEADIANSPEQNFGGKLMAGDIKYKDVDKDGKITEADKVPIGYPTTPEITYGFGLSAGYKGWDLSAFFQGNARSSFWIDPNRISPFIDTDDDNNTHSQNALLKVIADNHWSEANRNIYTFWPRLANESVPNNTQSSTWWMQDGSFMRLKSLELGYTLPERWTRKARISNVRIYLNGTNLLTFSKFKLWDPEMGGNGLGYPIQRVYNIGLSVNF